MILKKSDDKSYQIETLNNLLHEAPSNLKPKIQRELNFLRAGIKGEQECTYHIDFNFKDSENSIVLHDLRFELNGMVAQVDHLILHRTLRIYCIETKHFNSGIKINEHGEFMQWNAFSKVYEGVPSPLAQNERHIRVLDDIFDQVIVLPSRLGLINYPTFHSFVVVNNDARIERSPKFDSQRLVKCESLFDSIMRDLDNIGIGTMLKVVSYQQLEDIAKQLIELHKPIAIDYHSKFGMNPKPHNNGYSSFHPKHTMNLSDAETKVPYKDNDSHIHKCQKCESDKISIQYGKFGYYFKCKNCNGNSNIKLVCVSQDHKVKLRKDGNRFYQECEECKSSVIYFVNNIEN